MEGSGGRNEAALYFNSVFWWGLCYGGALLQEVLCKWGRGLGVGGKVGAGLEGCKCVAEPFLLSHRCWDDYTSLYWWVIKAPILLAIFVSMSLKHPGPRAGGPSRTGEPNQGSVQSLRHGFPWQVNFLIFLNVTRMLAQKIRSPDISKNYKQQYM